MEEQLLLFHESDVEKLQREVVRLRNQCESVRKGQFAKIGELKKMYLETKCELDILKAAICKGTKLVQLEEFLERVI